MLIYTAYFKATEVSTSILSFFEHFFVMIMEKAIKQVSTVVELMKVITKDKFEANDPLVNTLIAELPVLKEYITFFYEVVSKC